MITIVDENIMKQLLSEPSVKESVAKMTDVELSFFRKLLVKQGIYQAYALEKQKEALNKAVGRSE